MIVNSILPCCRTHLLELAAAAVHHRGRVRDGGRDELAGDGGEDLCCRGV